MKRTRSTVEKNQRDALTLRGAGRSYQAIGDHLGISKQRAHQLVREALADMPREGMRDLHDLTCERLDILYAQAHAGAVMRSVLRDKHGHAVLDTEGEVIMVPPEPTAHVAYINAAARLAIERAKFGGAGAPEKTEVAHTRGVTMIGSGARFMFPVVDEEDFARKVAATEGGGGRAVHTSGPE